MSIKTFISQSHHIRHTVCIEILNNIHTCCFEATVKHKHSPCLRCECDEGPQSSVHSQSQLPATCAPQTSTGCRYGSSHYCKNNVTIPLITRCISITFSVQSKNKHLPNALESVFASLSKCILSLLRTNELYGALNPLDLLQPVLALSFTMELRRLQQFNTSHCCMHVLNLEDSCTSCRFSLLFQLHELVSYIIQ